MSNPQAIETARGGIADAEQMTPFHFPVIWSSLVDPGALASINNLPVIAEPRPTGYDPAMQWSMVVPKMTQAAALALPAAGSEVARFAAPRYVAPRFEVSLHSASLAVKMLLSAAVVMLLVPGWRDAGSPGASAVQLESTLSETNWLRQSAPDGNLVLYRPSSGQADYRLQFNWSVNPRGVAWVFRFQDAGNYYGVRIKPFGPMPFRRLSVERFAIHNGAAQSRSTKLLTLPGRYAAIPIRMDAAGASFKIYLAGNPVIQWMDTRLTTGSLGFFEDGAGHGEMHSIRISFP